jgi:hypothetical protein
MPHAKYHHRVFLEYEPVVQGIVTRHNSSVQGGFTVDIDAYTHLRLVLEKTDTTKELAFPSISGTWTTLFQIEDRTAKVTISALSPSDLPRVLMHDQVQDTLP